MLWQKMKMAIGTPPVRCRTVETLAASKADDALRLVTKALKDQHAGVREAAARASFQMGGSAVGQQVTPLLKDPESSVRCTAATLLGQMADLAVIEPLKAAMEDDKEAVRAASAEALRQLGWKPGNVSERIVHAIAVKDFERASCEGDAAVVPLSRVLDHPETTATCDAAIKALATIHTPQAEAELSLQYAVALVSAGCAPDYSTALGHYRNAERLYRSLLAHNYGNAQMEERLFYIYTRILMLLDQVLVMRVGGRPQSTPFCEHVTARLIASHGILTILQEAAEFCGRLRSRQVISSACVLGFSCLMSGIMLVLMESIPPSERPHSSMWKAISKVTEALASAERGYSR